MDSLQSYLKNNFSDFFGKEVEKGDNDIEKAVEYNKWYKSHGNMHPSVKSSDLTEVHLAYWRIKMNDTFKEKTKEQVFSENFSYFLGQYIPK